MIATEQTVSTGRVALRKSDAAVAAVCDDESSRYALGGVHVKHTTNGRFQIEAVDGRRMLRVSRDCDPADQDRERIIPGKPFARLLKTCKSTSRVSGTATMDIEGDDAAVKIEIDNQGELTSTIIGTLDGRFPRTDEVLPKHSYDVSISDDEARGYRDPEKPVAILERFCQSMAESRNDFLTHGANRPVASAWIDGDLLAGLLSSLMKATPSENRGVRIVVPLNRGGIVELVRDVGPDNQSGHAVIMPLTDPRDQGK